jgi:hypothetical protein
MSFVNVENDAELRDAVASQLRNGSLSLSVPMYNGTVAPFDRLVADGLAVSYCLFVEINLTNPLGAL